MARGPPHRAVLLLLFPFLFLFLSSFISVFLCALFILTATTPSGRFRVLEGERLALEN